MEYLLIPLMCFLAVTKVSLQSQFSKSRTFGFADNTFYNFVMFTAAAILFLPVLFLKRTSADTYIFGIIAGILSVGFQLSYMFAFSCGKPVLVTTVNNFSMFIPIAVSCIFLCEPFGSMKMIALFFAAVSIWIITSKNNTKISSSATSNRWLLYTLLAFFCNGFISSNQKIYANFSTAFDAFSFVAITYVTASCLSFAIFKLTVYNKSVVFKWDKETIVSAGTSGIFLGIFQCVSTYAASVIDGVILYTVYNCATNILFVVVRTIFFRDNLSKKQILGLISGLCAILFMQ
ncbi:MAG: hypothetical protein IJ366_04290 [Clostridia bacterium]|nr:hypothetical protein [Clostridia bacterium]